jgi:glycosyltransferase involved in cell wall biosynthesis
MQSGIQTKLKIAQVSSSLKKEMGGPPQVVLNSNWHLKSKGFEVLLVICGQSKGTLLDVTSQRNFTGEDLKVFFGVRDSIYGKLLNFREMQEFRKIILDADIVLLHQVYNYQNIAASWICKVYGKKYLIMPHGTLTNYQARRHRKRKFFANIIFDKIIANAASIIVATDIEKIQIESKFKSRVDKVGIGLEIKVRSMVEEKVKIGRNFLFLGRIAEKKRIDITIKAFALFLADFPDAELTIAGDGDPKLISKLKILVSKLAISSSVKFVSWVSGDEKFKLYERTDYFVLNSEDENFAIAVAEAQSHGIPVLISKFVAFSEIVTDFESGVIVESLDIETVLAGMRTINEANYADLSRNSLQSANAVSWNSVIEKWVSVILDIDSK